MKSLFPVQTSNHYADSLPSLLNKRKWKPSSLELAVLQMHFEKDKFPSNEDKYQLITKLKETVGADLTITQLNDWFESERDNALKRVKTEAINNSYIKFGAEDLKVLKASFEKNNYPRVEEMTAMADQFGVNLSKIENWYKHHRRSLAKKGELDIKTKKYFNKYEIDYLMSAFRKNSRPSQEEVLVIAKQINCTEVQIKNWFSNKRKKFRLLNKAQKAQALNKNANVLSVQSSNSSETNSSGSTACLETNLLVPNNWNSSETDLSPQEAGQLSFFSRPESSNGGSSPDNMKIAAQQTIMKSSLFRESQQQQPLIDFGQFTSPAKNPQEFFSNAITPTINSFNQQFFPQQLNLPIETLRNLLLNQRNAQINQISYPLFQQLPIMSQNIPIQHQIGTNFQFQSNIPQLLNYPQTDIQTLLINNILAKNQLIQAQSMMH